MNPRLTLTSRIASAAFASLMTVAMLLSVDTLAHLGAPQQEMAATPPQSAQG